MVNEPLNRSLIYPFTHLRIHSLVNQIDQSMQNKPNFQNGKMSINSSITMNYEQKTMNDSNKNKPNSNPIYPELVEWNKPNFPDMANLFDIEIFVLQPKLKILILRNWLDILLKNYKLGLSAHSMGSYKKLF